MPLYGLDLKEVKRREILTEETSMLLLIEMIWSLQAFHLSGYTHQDLKPANFLLRKELPKASFKKSLGILLEEEKK